MRDPARCLAGALLTPRRLVIYAVLLSPLTAYLVLALAWPSSKAEIPSDSLLGFVGHLYFSVALASILSFVAPFYQQNPLAHR